MIRSSGGGPLSGEGEGQEDEVGGGFHHRVEPELGLGDEHDDGQEDVLARSEEDEGLVKVTCGGG